MLEEEEEGFEDAWLQAALEWLREAAANNVTAAQRCLGHCYLRAHGVRQDNRTAVGWIARAAKSGDGGAQFDMGRVWEDGVGVASNMTKAIACYRKVSVCLLARLLACVPLARTEARGDTGLGLGFKTEVVVVLVVGIGSKA